MPVDIGALGPWLGLGVVLGLGFYLGLWWTLSPLLRVRQAALWMLGSGLLRMGGVLLGLWWASQGGLAALLATLAGLLGGRGLALALSRRWRMPWNSLPEDKWN